MEGKVGHGLKLPQTRYQATMQATARLGHGLRNHDRGLRGQSQSIGCLNSQDAGAHEWRADQAASFECIPTAVSCRIIGTTLSVGPTFPGSTSSLLRLIRQLQE